MELLPGQFMQNSAQKLMNLSTFELIMHKNYWHPWHPWLASLNYRRDDPCV